MKTICTLAFICLIASAWTASITLNEQQKSKVKNHIQECIKQENASEADINRIQQLDGDSPSATMKCVAACVFEKLGVLKDNTLQMTTAVQKLIPIIGEEKTEDLSNKCKDIKGTDRCDSGFKIFNCIWS